MAQSPVYERNVELMEADVGDELVALDPDQGTCFGFNEVATAVWRQLREPQSFDQLKTHLLAAYDVTPEQCTIELRELVDDLVRRDLIKQID